MKRALVRLLTFGIASGVLLGACSSDSDPVSPPPPLTPPDTALTNPSFATDIQTIFNQNGCTQGQCHGSDPGQADLNLAAGRSYGELVDVQATQEPQFIRVVPNDADVSYLIIKLEGRQTQGDQMGELSTPTIQTIKNWINNGAPNN